MMMKSILYYGSLLLAVGGSQAFTQPVIVVTRSTTTTTASSSAINLIEPRDVADFGYSVTVKKPIGVVFGENNAPYLGLRVDDVEIGTEGSRVGMRVGDQLMAIGNDVVIGESFDTTMGFLQSAPSTKLKLILFRGSVRDLYTILDNRGLVIGDDDGSEEVIMDENYESPVRVEVVEPKEFDLGFVVGRTFELLGGGKKEEEVVIEEPEPEPVYEEPPAPAPQNPLEGIMGMFGGPSKDPVEEAAPAKIEQVVEEPPAPPKKKGGGGLFGMFGESIQLEGDDASGTGMN